MAFQSSNSFPTHLRTNPSIHLGASPQEAARARGRMQEVDPTLNLEAAQGEQYAMLQRSEGAEAGLGAAGYLAKDLNRWARVCLLSFKANIHECAQSIAPAWPRP